MLARFGEALCTVQDSAAMIAPQHLQCSSTTGKAVLVCLWLCGCALVLSSLMYSHALDYHAGSEFGDENEPPAVPISEDDHLLLSSTANVRTVVFTLIVYRRVMFQIASGLQLAYASLTHDCFLANSCMTSASQSITDQPRNHGAACPACTIHAALSVLQQRVRKPPLHLLQTPDAVTGAALSNMDIESPDSGASSEQTPPGVAPSEAARNIDEVVTGGAGDVASKRIGAQTRA